jgi:hypothetical protein
MSINSLGAPASTGTALNEMIKRTMSEVDVNRDGQLSTAEFGTFLTHLLQGLAQGVKTSNLSRVSTANVGATSTPTPTPLGPYYPVPGFVVSKLQDLTHVTDKYTPAVRCFSQALGSKNLKSVPESLPAIVEHAKNNGFPNAKIISHDCLDFGDGYGIIDVIVDVGGPKAHWWFNNNQ